MKENFTIQSLINKAVAPDPNAEKRTKESWWPTDLGKCLAGAYHRRMGVESESPFDERTYRVFKMGNLVEEFVVQQIASQYKEEEYSTQIRLEMPEYDMTGYADLLIEDLVYEIKSVNSRKFWYMKKRGGKPDRHYAMQTAAGVIALKKEEGRLIYISKDDLMIAEYVINKKQDKDLFDDVIKELVILNKAWDKKIPPLPVPAIIDGKVNWQASWCGTHKTCTGDPDWLKKANAEVRKLKKK